MFKFKYVKTGMAIFSAVCLMTSAACSAETISDSAGEAVIESTVSADLAAASEETDSPDLAAASEETESEDRTAASEETDSADLAAVSEEKVSEDPTADSEAASVRTVRKGDDIPRTGIISAMDNEISLLLKNADIDYVSEIGGEKFYAGSLCGKDVVIVKSGIGKVLAAAGASALLNNFNITSVLFTGIAGGVGDETKVLDVVVADKLVQHDYGQINAFGFKWTGGDTGDSFYECSEELVEKARAAAEEVVGKDHVFIGTIATGDQFVASAKYVKTLRDRFNAIACEMEGAAVAITCNQYDVPFVVIRSMSDKADGLAHVTYFNMGDRAADNSGRIVMQILDDLDGSTLTAES